MQSTQMIQRFSLIYQINQNTYGIALRKPQEALVSMGMQIKTEYMILKQKRAIFTRSSKPLEFVDQFTYLKSNISSAESDFIIRLVKA